MQGVGFRPFVFRLARANSLAGWVLNEERASTFIWKARNPLCKLFLPIWPREPPAAAQITAIDVRSSNAAGLSDFTIRESRRNGNPSVRISPDLTGL